VTIRIPRRGAIEHIGAKLRATGVILLIIGPAISHAQDVAIGPVPDGLKLSLEKLVRREAFFPEVMSVHLILENLDARPFEQLTINCRTVDVDGFTLERSNPRNSATSLQPTEKIRVVVSIPEHASTNKVLCNIAVGNGAAPR
jgi:hypothetical protein